MDLYNDDDIKFLNYKFDNIELECFVETINYHQAKAERDTDILIKAMNIVRIELEKATGFFIVNPALKRIGDMIDQHLRNEIEVSKARVERVRSNAKFQ